MIYIKVALMRNMYIYMGSFFLNVLERELAHKHTTMHSNMIF